MMKKIGQLYKQIYQKERGLFLLLVLLAMVAMVVAAVMFLNLSSSSTVVKVGYSDLKGYKDGSWRENLVMPGMVLIVGLMHNLLIARIYTKKGAELAKMLVMVSLAIIGLIIVMSLRLAEGR